MTLPNHPEKIVRDAKVLAQQELATNVYFLVVESPEIARRAKAGQFVQLRILSGDFTLRRPSTRRRAASPSSTASSARARKRSHS